MQFTLLVSLATPFLISAPFNGEAVTLASGVQLQMTGPFLADIAYGVVPSSHIEPITSTASTWYAVTRGRYVGVFSQM